MHKLITHENGKELANPTVKDFAVGMEGAAYMSNEFYGAYDIQEIGSTSSEDFVDNHYVSGYTKNSKLSLPMGGYLKKLQFKEGKRFLDKTVIAYPVLRPLLDLRGLAEKGELPPMGGLFFIKDLLSKRQYDEKGYWDGNKRIEKSVQTKKNKYHWRLKQLRWLRDNGFCTADFRFAGEVKHVKKIAE